jgi:hypothetical protein
VAKQPKSTGCTKSNFNATHDSESLRAFNERSRICHQNFKSREFNDLLCKTASGGCISLSRVSAFFSVWILNFLPEKQLRVIGFQTSNHLLHRNIHQSIYGEVRSNRGEENEEFMVIGQQKLEKRKQLDLKSLHNC